MLAFAAVMTKSATANAYIRRCIDRKDDPLHPHSPLGNKSRAHTLDHISQVVSAVAFLVNNACVFEECLPCGRAGDAGDHQWVIAAAHMQMYY